MLNYFQIGPVVFDKKIFWWPCFSKDQNNLSNVGRGSL